MMENALFQWVGYAAGTLTTLAFLPQVLHVWKTKRADDLHIGWLVSLTAGVVLWLVYGIFTRQRPVIVANAVTLALVVALTVMKARYSRAGARNGEDTNFS
jgi:MtN3 and saliva related transmembrane protein